MLLKLPKYQAKQDKSQEPTADAVEHMKLKRYALESELSLQMSLAVQFKEVCK